MLTGVLSLQVSNDNPGGTRYGKCRFHPGYCCLDCYLLCAESICICVSALEAPFNKMRWILRSAWHEHQSQMLIICACMLRSSAAVSGLIFCKHVWQKTVNFSLFEGHSKYILSLLMFYDFYIFLHICTSLFLPICDYTWNICLPSFLRDFCIYFWYQLLFIQLVFTHRPT